MPFAATLVVPASFKMDEFKSQNDGFCKSAGNESSGPSATKQRQSEAARGAYAAPFGVPEALLGTPWAVLGALWAASGVPLMSPGRLLDAAGTLQDAPGPPKKHFRWLQGPPGRSLGRFPRIFFCRKCVKCLRPCPKPDATYACRRGCITSDEASICSVQVAH